MCYRPIRPSEPLGGSRILWFPHRRWWGWRWRCRARPGAAVVVVCLWCGTFLSEKCHENIGKPYETHRKKVVFHGIGHGFTLWCHQTWLAGKSPWMKVPSYSNHKSLWSIFQQAMFDDTGGYSDVWREEFTIQIHKFDKKLCLKLGYIPNLVVYQQFSY